MGWDKDQCGFFMWIRQSSPKVIVIPKTVRAKGSVWSGSILPANTTVYVPGMIHVNSSALFLNYASYYIWDHVDLNHGLGCLFGHWHFFKIQLIETRYSQHGKNILSLRAFLPDLLYINHFLFYISVVFGVY